MLTVEIPSSKTLPVPIAVKSLLLPLEAQFFTKQGSKATFEKKCLKLKIVISRFSTLLIAARLFTLCMKYEKNGLNLEKLLRKVYMHTLLEAMYFLENTLHSSYYFFYYDYYHYYSH
jgi:hypothetical protein